ncbi:MAG: cyanoexosortase B [Leptolyngbyaceae cyanobacterium MO_188.B28]|nr:cyanoexosortase B [Leptolyngbyaceae cyanobacterium MO_188.B28]
MLTKHRVFHVVERYPLEIALLGLLSLLYFPLMGHWVDGWLNKSISIQHEYFSHGLIGLPFAAYIAWTHRPKWGRLPDAFHPLGLGLLLIAAVFYLSGLSDWMNLSLPLMLGGLCLSLKGLAGFRLQAFPLALVFLATPTQAPYLIEPYILPLQKFIAAVAGFFLLQMGIDVQVDQIYLLVNSQVVEVAPHCAGLKMLFTSFYVGLMLLYWTGVWKSRLRTSFFLVSTVAVSVNGNIVRNTVLSFFHGTGQSGAFYWLHDSWGGDLYSAAMLLLLVGLLQLIERYVPEKLELEVSNDSPV